MIYILKKPILLLLFIGMIVIDCCEGEVVVTAREGSTIIETCVSNEIEAFGIGNIYKSFTDIKGLDKLAKMKKLVLFMVSLKTDLSFLSKLTYLEVLVIYSCSLNDLRFLTELINLKILLLKETHIINANVDLSMNAKLEYFGYINSYMGVSPNYKNVIFTGIPQSLKYIDFSRSHSLTISRSFMLQIKDVPYIYFDKGMIEKYGKELKCFTDKISQNRDDSLPKEMHESTLTTMPIDGFY